MARIKKCISLTIVCNSLLETYAQKRGISQAAIIEQAVREIVARWDNEPQIAQATK